jgi:hypothetical protein
MTNHYFTIPRSAELEKIDRWRKDPTLEHRYAAVRGHYLLRGPFQLDEPVRKGEVIGASTPLQGVSEKRTYTTEYEVSTVQMSEMVQEALRESEAVRSFEGSLSAGIGSSLAGKISSGVKASASRRLLDSFKESFKISISETQRVKKTVTREYEIDPSQFEPEDTLVFVKAYKAFVYKLYLQFIDYLVVEYTGTPTSLRLKRTKLPPAATENHRNILRLNLPLCAIRFWRELPESSLLLDEKAYKNEVEDPDEIKIEGLRDSKRYPAGPIPPKPTLYDIAERLFPAKIWR